MGRTIKAGTIRIAGGKNLHMANGPAREEDGIKISGRGRRSGKLRVLTRDNLDGRTKAAQQFDAIASGIAEDLGGEDRLSTVAKHLVEAFAGAALHVNDLNARLLLGEKVDIVNHAQAISAMVRVASRIGIHRIARDVTPPDVADYVAHLEEQDQEAIA
jgi:hypothetical protein